MHDSSHEAWEDLCRRGDLEADIGVPMPSYERMPPCSNGTQYRGAPASSRRLSLTAGDCLDGVPRNSDEPVCIAGRVATEHLDEFDSSPRKLFVELPTASSMKARSSMILCSGTHMLTCRAVHAEWASARLTCTRARGLQAAPWRLPVSA